MVRSLQTALNMSEGLSGWMMDLVCFSIELSDEGLRADNLFPAWIFRRKRDHDHPELHLRNNGLVVVLIVIVLSPSVYRTPRTMYLAAHPTC